MNVVEFIRQVRDGESLDPAQIRAFVTGVAQGNVPDYQASAYLMAVYHQDLKMTRSSRQPRDAGLGKPINLSHIDAVKVDKHSTGGVGDKISIPGLGWLAVVCRYQ